MDGNTGDFDQDHSELYRKDDGGGTNSRSVPDILRAEGTELRQSGNTFRGICLLHDLDGRNPSFVCGETWWKCYSCGEGGDGPAFIMKLKGFNFPLALEYLGEEVKRPTRQDKTKQAKERREKAAARWIESELARTLGIAIRRCNETLIGITPETLDNHALILQQLLILEHHHQILIHGSPADKVAVMAE